MREHFRKLKLFWDWESLIIMDSYNSGIISFIFLKSTLIVQNKHSKWIFLSVQLDKFSQKYVLLKPPPQLRYGTFLIFPKVLIYSFALIHPSPVLGNHNLLSLAINWPVFFRVSYKWSYTVCNLLCLTNMVSHLPYFEILSYFCMHQ